MANSSPSGTNRGSQRLVRILVSLLVFVGICVVTFVCVWQFGFVSGEEFDPSTFERRSFYYYELPLLGIQIIPITRSSTTSNLETHISNLLKANQAGGGDWDLVSLYRSAQKHSDGDASLLCTYIDIKIDGTQQWLTWSQEHPKLAQVLWPAVADLARNHMYIFVPTLMELAKAADDPVAFQRQLDTRVSRQYADLATKQTALDKHLLAVTLFDEALRFAPLDEASNTLRDASFSQLTEEEQARLVELQSQHEAIDNDRAEPDNAGNRTAEEPAS